MRSNLILLDHEADWGLRKETGVFLRGCLDFEAKKAEEIWTKGKRIKPGRDPEWPWDHYAKGEYGLLESWCFTSDLHKLRPYLFPGWETWPRYMYKAGKDWSPCNLPEGLWQSPYKMGQDAVRAVVTITDVDVCRLVDLKPYEVYDLIPERQTRVDPDEVLPLPEMKHKRKGEQAVLTDYILLMREAAPREMRVRCFGRETRANSWVYVVRYSVDTFEELEERKRLRRMIQGARA